MEKPVIGTRVGGIPDQIIDGVNGFLVPPRDPEAIAERIAWLVDNPGEAFDVEGVARAICEFKQNRELYEQARRGALRLFRERHRAVISRYFSNIIKMLVSKSIK